MGGLGISLHSYTANCGYMGLVLGHDSEVLGTGKENENHWNPQMEKNMENQTYTWVL